MPITLLNNNSKSSVIIKGYKTIVLICKVYSMNINACIKSLFKTFTRTPICKTQVWATYLKRKGKRFYILTNQSMCYFIVKNVC